MRARHPGPWLTGIVIFGLGALGLSPVAQAAGLGATSALVGQPSRVGSYDNAAVADVMLSYVNQNGVNVCLGTPYGSAYPGECKQTVNCAIYRASGGTQRPGGGDDYFGSFIAAGGVEVAQANAVKGDVIQWGSGTTGSQHTAVVVENRGGGNFRVVDSNFNRDHIVRDHVMNVNTFFPGYTPRFARMGTPMSPAPAVPTGLRATGYNNKTVLTWNSSSGATDYLVLRNGRLVGTTTGTTFTDWGLSPSRYYTYQVQARNAAGTSAAAIQRPGSYGAGPDRAFLPSKWGPAECGRAGETTSQGLVCNIKTATGWVRTGLPYVGDWGYGDTRSWIANRDGTISYCSRVGLGAQVRCDTYNGTTWVSSVSAGTDLGYDTDRAFLPSKWGPAECGRAGDSTSQRLVCNIKTATGWVRTGLPYVGDWGYADTRSWIANRDGTISYCAAVGSGDQLRCDTYNGTTWVSSTSPGTDLGYK